MRIEHASPIPNVPARLGLLLSLGMAVLAVGLTACQSTQSANDYDELKQRGAKPPPIVLREGDSVRISFPGAPNLNAVQVIRRDGRVTLPLVGEYSAAGKTPTEMEQDLLKLYEPQLQSKEVSVAVEASAFPIYVTGAVLRPGRVNADRPLTALEAVLEAGVDYSRANLKSVRVVRGQDGKSEYFNLNLKKVLEGKGTDTFTLRPEDIVYVPEKFSWF